MKKEDLAKLETLRARLVADIRAWEDHRALLLRHVAAAQARLSKVEGLLAVDEETGEPVATDDQAVPLLVDLLA